MPNLKSTLTIRLLLALFGALIYIPFLGEVHLFDWDEINFAEAAREMLVTGNYSVVTINYNIFWEKPPLFIWFQALAMKIFGVNEFAARFPNAIAGILTIQILFEFGRRYKNQFFGLLWALTYTGSLLPLFYFKSGIIDPWFNLFMFLSVMAYLNALHLKLAHKSRSTEWFVLAAAACGLAILTKGPAALLLVGGTVGLFYLLRKFHLPWPSPMQWLISILALLFVGGSWFWYEMAIGEYQNIVDFVNYQIRLLQQEDAGHGGPWFYHFVVLWIGCFPMSAFVLKGMRKASLEKTKVMNLTWLMIAMLCVVLVIFSIVQTKIIHYSSLCYFPMSFLAARALSERSLSFRTWTKVLFYVPGVLLGILLTALPWVGKFLPEIIDSIPINDPFAAANLQATVHWSGWESIVGIAFLLLLFKFSWLKQANKAVLFLGSTLVIFLTFTVWYVPKIEGYTQRAAIEFYESKQSENVQVAPYGFKSYAHLFYTQRTPEAAARKGKPIYFVTKIHKTEDFEAKYPNYVSIGAKNGFVFYKKSSD